MSTTHSLENLKHYHNEAIQFFGAELILLQEAIAKITDERIAKTATLLISGKQTGAALIQLATQVECFSSEVTMLARSFMETVTNFCYASVCDAKEYRAFILHPIYKYYFKVGTSLKEGIDNYETYREHADAIKKKREKLKEIPIVQEALTIFSETKPNLSWSKKSLNERIKVLEEWGKFLDVFFSLNKIEYYSDASEALHGSLYGCTYDIGAFDPDFDHTNKEELYKKLYKDEACMILYLGTLIHESLTLIKYSNDISDIWDYSYKNRGLALNLLSHIQEINPTEVLDTYFQAKVSK
ncbi:DUF5677 domain-containing protein [Dysgonomonas gadei]|uniref:Uncharacterized protein n=1 Tax=Dysgonomonas gadei ATCC BAA-286 TaxID=742766 RepID=F5IVB3_9BACT|nr:DUF5677 domain-containing protein [Dysgonomonas gadei]EGK02563.1 hypothetical protein HMPREF9455_00813 [Dysgonomonas gadei ATCC BAA-286]